MRETINNLFCKNRDAVWVFVLMLIIFSIIMFYVKWATDLPAHALIAQQMLEEHHMFDNNFLMYLLINILSLFSRKKYILRIALTFLIVCSETAKYVVTREMIHEYASEREAKLVSFLLLFIYVIPWFYICTGEMYYGYYVPNVWHNSTIICSMPFAIGMYWLALKQFAFFEEKRNRVLTLLTLFCVLIKPSFFFVFSIAYPIILYSRYGFNRDFFLGLLPMAVGTLCVVYEILSIYGRTSDGSYVYFDTQSLMFLDFWRMQIPYIICSFAFPTLYCISHPKIL